MKYDNKLLLGHCELGGVGKLVHVEIRQWLLRRCSRSGVLVDEVSGGSISDARSYARHDAVTQACHSRVTSRRGAGSVWIVFEAAADEADGFLALHLTPRHAPLSQPFAVLTVNVEVVEVLQRHADRVVPPRELRPTVHLERPNMCHKSSY